MNKNQFATRFSAFLFFLSFLVVSNLQAYELDEVGWPKVINAEKYDITIYQPQIESLSANKMEARAAVSVKIPDVDMPQFGAIWMEFSIKTDMESRLIEIHHIKITDAKSSSGDTTKIEAFKKVLEKEINGESMTIELDRVLADLDENKTQVALESNLKNEAPDIFYSNKSAVLVMIDGDPILKDADDSKLKYVLNTPYIIINDPKKDLYYLKGGNFWYKSEQVTSGWEHITRPPKKVQELADQAAGEEQIEETEDEEPPVVYVSTKAAELIILDGEPDYGTIEGTELLYVKNTESDLIMDIKGQRFYLLLAGRWYSSESLPKGDWQFMDQKDLPKDFAKIPAESDMGTVRASVVGTSEAKEAALENQIPQTAEIEIKSATLTVEYDGDPQFKKIEGTKMSFAVNTDKSVLEIKSKYYCCDDAVWFKANRATGPWEVATSIPNDIQDLPPECPIYNVKYVYIYESTPDVVYVGYTPGYTWSYVHYGCVVYGTGYYYRPWYGRYYYPRPVTYGYGVHYNPYTGWGFTVGVSYGWFHMGWGAPYYRGYWGPAGYRYGYRHGYHRGYHHGYRHGAHAGYRAGYRAGQRNSVSNNIYRNRKNGVRNTGVTRQMPDRNARPATGQARQGRNDVLTDKNGNVYRRDNKGDWNQRKDGKWQSPVDKSTREARPNQPSTRESRPTQPSTREARPSTPSTRESRPSTSPSTPNNLNRDYQSRERGTQRSQQYRSTPNYNRSTPSRSAPSRSAPRSGGGARRR